MPLPLFAIFRSREIITWNKDCYFRIASFMTFHVCLCMFVCVPLSMCVCVFFLELWRLLGNAINLFFEAYRELLVVLSFQGTHILSLHEVLVFFFVPDLLSHSPLNTRWCVWYICLNMHVSFYIVLFWVCMCYYINIELQMSFFSLNTTWYSVYLVDSDYSVYVHCILSHSLRDKHVSYLQFPAITTSL